MKKLVYLAPLAFTVLLSNCKKKDSDPQPGINFTISLPAAGQEFNYGDSVRIAGEISNPTDIHGYEITATTTDSNKVLFEQHVHAHGTKVPFRAAFQNQVKRHTEVELKVEVTLDHKTPPTTAEWKGVYHLHPQM